MCIFSLAFLYWASKLKSFSKIVTSMSAILWPGRLKWWPVALARCWLATYPLCSENLDCSVLSVSPIYCILHFLQLMQYTAFFVWQLTGLLIVTCTFVSVAFTVFPTFMNGQMTHLLHFVIPGIILWGLMGVWVEL